MNILVFGKDGQLGKAFQSLFQSLPDSENIKVTFLNRTECDLSDTSQIVEHLTKFQPNLIINASAYTAVDKAETDIDQAFAVNAKAPEVMARYASQNNCTFLHYSTDYVFDGAKNGSYSEIDARNPLSIYGKSKAAGEESIERVFAEASLGQYAILRTSWVYGDGGNFISTILRLAKEREELKIINDQYGVPTSANWLARVSLDLALDADYAMKSFASGIYHAVPEGKTTWYELGKFVVQVASDLDVQLRVKPDVIRPIFAVEYPLPAPRPMNSCMDRSKLLNVVENDGDMSKLEAFNEPWTHSVQEYVKDLAKKGLI